MAFTAYDASADWYMFASPIIFQPPGLRMHSKVAYTVQTPAQTYSECRCQFATVGGREGTYNSTIVRIRYDFVV
jgi:hypothetical protein